MFVALALLPFHCVGLPGTPVAIFLHTHKPVLLLHDFGTCHIKQTYQYYMHSTCIFQVTIQNSFILFLSFVFFTTFCLHLTQLPHQCVSIRQDLTVVGLQQNWGLYFTSTAAADFSMLRSENIVTTLISSEMLNEILLLKEDSTFITCLDIIPAFPTDNLVRCSSFVRWVSEGFWKCQGGLTIKFDVAGTFLHTTPAFLFSISQRNPFLAEMGSSLTNSLIQRL